MRTRRGASGAVARNRLLTKLRPWFCMANYIRPRCPAATVFFTVNLAHRGASLLVDRVQSLREAVMITRMNHPFAIDAWVVLPDHMHCIWTLPPGDSDYATRWRVIKSRFSRQMPPVARRPSQVVRREHGIWQRRFWEHHIRDEADYVAHLAYCWNNPVKHGFVAHPADWPYSSYHRDNPDGKPTP